MIALSVEAPACLTRAAVGSICSGTPSSTETNRSTRTAYADTPGSAWTNNAATSASCAGTSGSTRSNNAATYARSSCSTRTNRATSTTGGFAADGAACLAPACGSRITGSALETRAATRQPRQASYEKGCHSRWHLEHMDEHGSHVPGGGYC